MPVGGSAIDLIGVPLPEETNLMMYLLELLSLVVESLIDSNSNNNNKDAEYVEIQQQNVADGIDLLPRLTTDIDVNDKFLREWWLGVYPRVRNI
ncbi:hypothetical protein SOVF_091150 isoform B [Spinacia oleracea]|nr:hypothetical protein SOVF_091150 isoform B [Spinacia oleracea]